MPPPRCHLVVLLGLLICTVAFAAPTKFRIPAQPASSGLKLFTEQCGLKVVYNVDDLRDVRTNELLGEHEPAAALALLVEGTGLKAEARSTGIYTVTRTTTDRPATNSPAGTGAVDQPRGEITGRVVNALNGNYVSNARISVEGHPLETRTDEAGKFTLRDVPLGTAAVRASYVGFETAVKPVEVGSGTNVMDDITLAVATLNIGLDAVTTLAPITVVADRELSARAIAMNEQRNSPNLKNVVAMDEYPVDGNGNIGEFLKYIPGVAVTFSGSQPIDVSVRGLPGNTTPIMIDGGNLPSTASSDSRGGSLTGVPMTNVSRIEVTKVPTPDVPASSLGGSINIISKSGFELRDPEFTYNIYTTFNADLGLTLKDQPAGIDYLRTPSIGPSANFSYVHPVNNNLALSIGGSYIYNYIPADQTAPFWNLNTLTQYQSTFQSTPQLVIMRNYNFGADWRIGDKNTFALTIQSRDRGTEATTAGFNVIYGAGAVGGPTSTVGTAAGVGSVTQSPSWLGIWSDAKIVNFRHKFSNRDWKVETSASYAETYTLRDSPGYFTGAALGRSNLVLRGDGIGDNADDMRNTLPTSYTAFDRNGNAVDIFDQSQLSLTSATYTALDWDRTNQQFKSAVTREFDGKVPLTVKAGIEIAREDYKQGGGTDTYTFRTGTSDAVRQIGNYGLIDPSYSSNYAGGRIQWVNLEDMYRLYVDHPEYFAWNESASYTSYVNTYKTLEETISAGFLRVDAKLFNGRLWLVGGVRYEHTAAKGEGPLNDPTAWLQKDANGNLVRTSTGATIPITNDALARTKLQLTRAGAKTERDYDGYYPSLNASFEINDYLLARFGYARTIGRPNRNFIVPGVTFSAITATPQTITINNTGLLPWEADNFDLALESYLYKGGVGSISVFQKDITGFFESTAIMATPDVLALYGITDATDVDYEVLTRRNGTSPTRIRGFEFNYRQPLQFLPAWAEGLQVFLNYTRLELDGSNNADFTGFNPETLSYGVNLTRPRYSVKFLMQVQGETRRAPVAVNASTGIPANTFLWQGAKERPTLTGEFRVTKRLSVYGSISDFLDGGFRDVQRRYPDGGSTPAYARFQRVQEWGYSATIGVKGEF